MAYDTDGNGYLEKMEMMQVAEELHERLACGQRFDRDGFEKGFEQLDDNGDGHVQLEEFINWYLQNYEKPTE